LNTFATQSLAPDLTLVFDVSPEVGQARRAAGRDDRIESRGTEFHARVRQAFRDLARLEPERVEVLSALASPAEIHREVLETLRVRHMIDL
ncbi:dTMP kinase, partial [Fusobacterium necrophorum]|uniref:dTMP kinase n=1 Tax=Fusobacterium necrophorum TaxID=859 RepID=UPI00254E7125